MKFRLAALCALCAPLAIAQPLPPAVQTLKNELDETGAQLNKLHDAIKTTEAKQGAAAKSLRQSSAGLVQMAALPESVVLAHTIMSRRATAAPSVLTATRNQLNSTLEQNTARLSNLTSLYADATVQNERLLALQQQFSGATGKLAKLEQQVLKSAAMQAGVLGHTLEQALKKPEKTNIKSAIPAVAVAQPAASLMPVAGRLLHDFHETDGARGEGWTFSAKPGAEIISITGGEVLYSGPFRNFGGMVIISPGNRKHVVYAGLGTLSATAGQQVQAGQVLGTLGGTQLYVEYRERGTPRSPQKLYAQP